MYDILILETSVFLGNLAKGTLASFLGEARMALIRLCLKYTV